ncbi:MAG: tRNA lysidine(34) synthetase TilS [Candidatus Latescibacteria bacterium]|nr:tRNA lysidine(34) synthetase TilS [Candidatus Latescibacterota bacterium]
MPRPNLPEVASEALARHNMIRPGDHIVVAVSGGPDSVALLHLLHALRERLETKLTVAHLNHQLRSIESDKDAAFVQDLASSLDLACVVESADVPDYCERNGCSLETGAREVRYQYLERVVSDLEAQKIATGHTADDQAETILMRLVRGTGVDGLSGIRPVRDDLVIRPLLDVRREDVMAYLESHDLSYRIDPSNSETYHLRNRIRQTLIPGLEKDFNPEIVRALGRLGDVVRFESAFMEEIVDRSYQEVVRYLRPDRLGVDAAAYLEAPIPVQRRLVRRFLGVLGVHEAGFGYDHIEQFRHLATKQKSGQQLNLPNGLVAERRRDEIVVGSKLFDPFDIVVSVPGTIAIASAGGSLHTEVVPVKRAPKTSDYTRVVFNADEITYPLHIRSRLQGDRFMPFGMKGTKSLKSLFNERRIPRMDRCRIPVIANKSGILWVVGLRRSRIAPIDPKTERVLVMSWTED